MCQLFHTVLDNYVHLQYTQLRGLSILCLFIYIHIQINYSLSLSGTPHISPFIFWEVYANRIIILEPYSLLSLRGHLIPMNFPVEKL